MINTSQIKTTLQHMESALRSFGNTVTVTLTPEQTTVTMQAGEKARSGTELTDGHNQDFFDLVICVSDWDALANRMPRKGDIINIQGLEYAIERAKKITAFDVPIFYRLRILG